MAAVAEQMGYETEAAFRKAFKRVHGVGPSATGPRIAHAPWRSRHRRAVHLGPTTLFHGALPERRTDCSRSAAAIGEPRQHAYRQLTGTRPRRLRARPHMPKRLPL
ncbi:hypothetical protein [Nevskia sp.]|uniref:hypothetical protein n=1 Tax=Nevskia sp. TaxID=1929292 RepID=UPI00345A465D